MIIISLNILPHNSLLANKKNVHVVIRLIRFYSIPFWFPYLPPPLLPHRPRPPPVLKLPNFPQATFLLPSLYNHDDLWIKIWKRCSICVDVRDMIRFKCNAHPGLSITSRSHQIARDCRTLVPIYKFICPRVRSFLSTPWQSRQSRQPNNFKINVLVK